MEMVSNKPYHYVDVYILCIYAEVDGLNLVLSSHQQHPTLSLCSSSSKAERTKVEHGFQRYEACIRDIPTHTLHLRTFEVSILPSWVVEEWNGRESDHFYSSCQVAWGFFNKFSKQTLLSSSFDSLGSLNVYVSLPRHLTCLFFILLLVMAIRGA